MNLKKRIHLTFISVCLFNYLNSNHVPVLAHEKTESNNFAHKPICSNLTIGLALSGGGTRGCAHIGVLRILEQENIHISYIAGTSMGAIVGGLYAAGLSLDEIEKLINSKKLLHAFDTIPIPARIALIPIFFIPHLLGYHPYDGLYKGNKFSQVLSQAAPTNHKLIEQSKIPFAAIGANLLDGKAYAIRSGDIGKALQASSAIPFLRRPVEIGDKLFVDGGIVNNLPCDQVREMGANFIIAVDVDDDLEILEKKHFRKIGSSSNRALDMHLSALDQFQLTKADFVIHPNLSGIKLLSHSIKDAQKAIKSGESKTKSLLPSLKEKLEQSSISLSNDINKAMER